MHEGEEGHARPGWTTSRPGQDSPWKSQSEWQRTRINGESTSMVWPTLGWRTAKDQIRSDQILSEGSVNRRRAVVPLQRRRGRSGSTLRRSCTWRTRPVRRAGRGARSARGKSGPSRSGTSTTSTAASLWSRRRSSPAAHCARNLHTDHAGQRWRTIGRVLHSNRNSNKLL